MAIAVLARAVLAGLSLAVVGLLTRNLGVAGFGDYNAVLAYIMTFVTLADMGLYSLLVREISRPAADEKSAIGAIVALRLILAVALGLAAYVIVQFLPYSSEIKSVMAVAGFYAVFSSATQILTGIFQKYLKTYLVSIADVISRLLQLVLVFLAVIYGRGDLLIFISIIALSELVHLLLILFFAKRIVDFGLRFNRRESLRWLKTSFPIAVSLVFVFIYFKMDTVILSLMKPAYDVGVYSVAYKVLELVIFVPAIYMNLMLPILSHLAGAGGFTAVFRKAFRVISVLSLPAGAYLFVMAEKIVVLIGGADFLASAGVLKILSLAVMLIFFGNLGGNALIALNLQKKAMWIYGLGAAANLSANIVFIPRYSYLAAAWSTVATELLVTAGMFWLLRNQFEFRPAFLNIIKPLIAAVAMIIAIRLIGGGLVLGTLISVIYFPMLVFLGGLNKKDLLEVFSPKIRTDY